MTPPPPGLLPVAYDDRFDANSTELRAARRLFAGTGVVGVETVAVAANGSLGLVTRFGDVSARLGGVAPTLVAAAVRLWGLAGDGRQWQGAPSTRLRLTAAHAPT